jgi:tRNA nucleotidyltransferase (CCA-adding enzyme)
MLLILTHENADFDAVAAQLAAHKLHPAGTPLLSRRVNRNVNQFLALYWDALPFRRPASWRRKRVDEIILVDTQSIPSIRGIRPDTAVTVIDHHQPSKLVTDWTTYIEPLGSATTLLVEMIRKRGLALPPVEATLLLLGIYEDTGSLNYDSTTPRDLRAAAWLLEQGAELGVARRFLDVPFTPAQQQLYQELQKNVEWLRLEGKVIVLAALDAPPDFEDEISAIAHRMRDALAPDGLILLVGLAHHIQLVARSTSDLVDVGRLARSFGGGGHERAAAATIMDYTLVESVTRVKSLLPDVVTPAVRVEDIMSRRVKTIAPGTTVAAAAAEMQRHGHEGYPVWDSDTGRLVGLLTRRAVDRAISHKMDHRTVDQIMKSGQISVRSTDSVERVKQLMIAEDWGQIPVTAAPPGEGESDLLLGIVTRTDLLRLLGRPTDLDVQGNLRDRLADQLPPAHWALVRVVSQEADTAGMPIYFVGGLVRDLLLNLPAVDLDIVVEGDAVALTRRLQNIYGGRMRSHRRFGTAKWMLDPAGWQLLAPNAPHQDAAEIVDFVTARTEFYEQPTALPEVVHGSIKLDLHRRDFTINTLAVRLDGPHLGELLDFYGGVRDLEKGLIRVLHSLSFVDDPTRIMRAARYEQRLGFVIEPRTAQLIIAALPLMERVTGPRIRHELELALEEADPVPVLARFAELGVLAHIHPGLTWQESAENDFRRLESLLVNETWATALYGRKPTSVFFAVWLVSLPATVREEVMERFSVRKHTREEVEGLADLLQRLAVLPAEAPPSVVEKTLRPYAPWPRIFLGARAIVEEYPTGELLDRYWQEWRHVETALNGNDLREHGLKPGPQFAILLDHLLAARLDGRVHTRADEEQLLARLLARAEQ